MMTSSEDCSGLTRHRSDYRYQKVNTEMRSGMEDSEKVEETEKLAVAGKKSSYGGHNYDRIKPLTLTWKNVNVFAVPRDASCTSCRDPEAYTANEKQILFDVSGVVRPGELLAIMGASGAGKTTLMNYLTYQTDQGLRRQGDVRVNGSSLGKNMKFISAYVQQDDLFVSSLTVKEVLWFQAQLRIDEEVPDIVRAQRVDEVIHELGMDDLANCRIGNPGQDKALSSGERKRLSFASQVITNPGLMFCDEPTSGLDSYMAQTVVETLRRMASRGRTIVCTIHQPSSEVYRLLDRVCYMSEGRVSFIGPRDDLLNFFHGVGYVCPPNHNPADFIIHTLAIVPGHEEECRTRVHAICDAYEDSAYKSETMQAIEEATEFTDSSVSKQIGDPSPDFDDIHGSSPVPLRYKSSWIKQCQLLLWRVWANNARNPAINKGRFFQILVQSLISGMIYFQVDLDQKGVQDINGVIFLLQIQVTTGTVFSVINIIPSEFQLFLREHHSGMYTVSAYYLAHILCEIPFFIFVPACTMTLVVYFMIGLHMSVSAFLLYLFTNIVLHMTTLSFGHALATGTVNVAAAVSIGNLIVNPFMLFGGFMLNISTIPVYFKPLAWVSWLTYANEILVVNQWRDVDSIVCEYARPVYSYVNESLAIIGEDNSMCYNDGESVIQSYNFIESNIPRDLTCLALWAVAFEAFAYTFLAVRARQRQN